MIKMAVSSWKAKAVIKCEAGEKSKLSRPQVTTDLRVSFW